MSGDIVVFFFLTLIPYANYIAASLCSLFLKQNQKEGTVFDEEGSNRKESEKRQIERLTVCVNGEKILFLGLIEKASEHEPTKKHGKKKYNRSDEEFFKLFKEL